MGAKSKSKFCIYIQPQNIHMKNTRGYDIGLADAHTLKVFSANICT